GLQTVVSKETHLSAAGFASLRPPFTLAIELLSSPTINSIGSHLPDLLVVLIVRNAHDWLPVRNGRNDLGRLRLRHASRPAREPAGRPGQAPQPQRSARRLVNCRPESRPHSDDAAERYPLR